jgi:hypothetical protein
MTYYTRLEVAHSDKDASLLQPSLFLKGLGTVSLFTAEKANVFVIATHFLLAWTNAIAYIVTDLITTVISFVIQAPGRRYDIQLNDTQHKGLFVTLGINDIQHSTTAQAPYADCH